MTREVDKYLHRCCYQSPQNNCIVNAVEFGQVLGPAIEADCRVVYCVTNTDGVPHLERPDPRVLSVRLSTSARKRNKPHESNLVRITKSELYKSFYVELLTRALRIRLSSGNLRQYICVCTVTTPKRNTEMKDPISSVPMVGCRSTTQESDMARWWRNSKLTLDARPSDQIKPACINKTVGNAFSENT